MTGKIDAFREEFEKVAVQLEKREKCDCGKPIEDGILCDDCLDRMAEYYEGQQWYKDLEVRLNEPWKGSLP